MSPLHSGPHRVVGLTLAAALAVSPLAAVPASASAQGYTCEASALAATLGPSPRT